MNLNKIKMTMATGMLAASMILPSMTAMAWTGTNPTTTPNVKKTVEVADGVTLPDTKIEFKGTLTTNADGIQAPTGAAQTLTISSATFDGLKKDDTGLTNDQIKITDGIPTEVGEYTYIIEEDSLPGLVNGYGWTKTSPVTDPTGYEQYYLHILVKNTDAGVKSTEYYITTSNSSDDLQIDSDKDQVFKSDKKVDTLAFTNKYTKRGGSSEDPNGGQDSSETYPSLTITKTVNNSEYIAADTKYEFQISFTPDSLNPTKDTYAYVIKDASGTKQESGNLASGGTIELQKDWKVLFTDIPAGTTVNATELTSNKSYVTGGNMTGVAITYKSNGGTETSVPNLPTQAVKETDTLSSGDILIGESENTIEFENSFKQITVTGVVTDVAPYVTLVVVAVAAVAAYMGLKSRIAK